MNYSLAKKLKEAGFPQGLKPMFDAEGYIHRTNEEDENWVYEPSLEELIEACGNRFDELMKSKHIKDSLWRATAYPCEECDWKGMFHGVGSTPIEAVASLWLELNKK